MAMIMCIYSSNKIPVTIKLKEHREFKQFWKSQDSKRDLRQTEGHNKS